MCCFSHLNLLLRSCAAFGAAFFFARVFIWVPLCLPARPLNEEETQEETHDEEETGKEQETAQEDEAVEEVKQQQEQKADDGGRERCRR
jgi:hypothetical protein